MRMYPKSFLRRLVAFKYDPANQLFLKSLRKENEAMEIDRMIWRLEDAITKLNMAEARETDKETAVTEAEISKKFAANNASFNGQSRTFKTTPLIWDDGLALSAAQHCMDQGPEGKNSLYGTDKSTILERINRFGEDVGPNYA